MIQHERRVWARGRASVAAVLTALATALTAMTGLAAPAQATVTVDPDASYVLVNRQSGKVLEVGGWSRADGGVIQQWSRSDGPWQQWRFVPAGDGWFTVQNRHSGKVLDVWGWSTAENAEIRQYQPTAGANQLFRLAGVENGRIRLVNKHSGKAVTVLDRSLVDGARVVQLTDKPQYNQQWELVRVGAVPPVDPLPPAPVPPVPPVPADGVVGWAAQGGGTTGGDSAAATTVTSASGLTAAAAGTGAAVVRVKGTITCSGMLSIGSNKTIEGLSGSRIVGCGLNVSKATNVIVRNLAFDRWNDDAINVQGSSRVLVDHNTFLTGYDGSVDIKSGSDLVTVSWNRFRGQDKNSLVGHSDTNGSQDRGKLRVTYHHNWFDGTNQRNPRVRFGNPVHVFNNLYTSVGSYGVASTMEAGVLVEGNYFENTRDPFHRGEGSSPAGALVARGNHFVGSGPGQQGGTVAPVPYRYTLDRGADVKSIVQAGAGQH